MPSDGRGANLEHGKDHAQHDIETLARRGQRPVGADRHAIERHGGAGVATHAEPFPCARHREALVVAEDEIDRALEGCFASASRVETT
jgi:hypothetical protein